MRIAALLLFLLAVGCAADLTAMTVDVDAAARPEEIRKAIKMALAERGWTVQEESPGSVTAVISTSDVKFDGAVVSIAYGPGTVTISPVGDYGMNSGRVDGWIRNLAKDIPVQLDREQIREESPVN